ncbi:hypothetical protein [Roseomonas marmotae]|uniref:Molecular chaperone DnaJ n=1 Tax=Roseomonas marmotae TaxID=2768161 RepID=A0ABS3K771_9PROT|nr:hypothetical protein [Roseomonas marmotae]MBO1073306.1 hypothetical protein [Roseomonas marmotae]QTI79076.1 hypothetical protein IAI58_15810 [Roseomonas marmotae]
MTRQTPISTPETDGTTPDDETPPGATQTAQHLCRQCGGTGKVENETCPACGGRGTETVTLGDA